VGVGAVAAIVALLPGAMSNYDVEDVNTKDLSIAVRVGEGSCIKPEVTPGVDCDELKGLGFLVDQVWGNNDNKVDVAELESASQSIHSEEAAERFFNAMDVDNSKKLEVNELNRGNWSKGMTSTLDFRSPSEFFDVGKITDYEQCMLFSAIALQAVDRLAAGDEDKWKASSDGRMSVDEFKKYVVVCDAFKMMSIKALEGEGTTCGETTFAKMNPVEVEGDQSDKDFVDMIELANVICED